MDALTLEDCEILIEALTAWESKEASDALFGSTLSMMFSGMGKDTEVEKEEARQEALKKAEDEQNRIKEQGKIKREKSILLKAKLIQIRDAQGISSLLETSND